METVIEKQETLDTRPSISEVRARKKRGRPTNEELKARFQAENASTAQASVPPSNIFSASVCKNLSNIPFSLCGTYFKDENWNLDEPDKDFISVPLSDFLNELYPELCQKYPRAVILATMFGALIVKKYAEVSMKKQKTKAVEEAYQAQHPAEQVAENVVLPGGLTEAERMLKERVRGVKV